MSAREFAGGARPALAPRERVRPAWLPAFAGHGGRRDGRTPGRSSGPPRPPDQMPDDAGLFVLEPVDATAPVGSTGMTGVSGRAGSGDASGGHDERKVADQLTHDIRHEFSTIVMLAEAVNHATGDTRELLDHLVSEVRRTDGLLVALRQAGGRPAAADDEAGAPATVVLHEVVEDVAGPLRSTCNISIEVLATSLTVTESRMSLWRAVRNLVGNAIDAAPDGGHISIRVYSRPGLGVVQIDDDGPGIPDAASPRDAGRGLGLTIVRELAAGWGGRLELSRNDHGGCRARLLIPLPPPLVGVAS